MENKFSPSDYFLLVLLATIFGSSFMMTKISLQALPPMFVVSFRLLVAASVLVLIMIAARQWFPKGKVWIALIASAFFGHALPFSLLTWGQESVDAGLAAILMASMPLFTLFLAQIFTNDEKPNRYSVMGFAIALIGIVVLFGPDKLASLADQTLRQYAIILAAMCYGVNAIVTKYLVHIPWQQATASFMVVAFIMSLPLLMFEDLSAISASSLQWASAVYVALLPTALAAGLVIYIVSRTSASFLSQINFLVPLFGVLFAILFLGEVLPPNGAIALLIILAGVALARRRPKREIISINKGM